jgi:hypothetical protein
MSESSCKGPQGQNIRSDTHAQTHTHTYSNIYTKKHLSRKISTEYILYRYLLLV